MIRSGWNPTKRNRNIGTERQGQGRDNKLVIPWSRHHDYHRLTVAFSESRKFGEQEIHFLVERTRRGCVHSCTIEDVATVLSHVPPADIEGLGLIVLRQPSRKQELLDSCWGRILLEAEIENYIGPTIFLEAIDSGKLCRWSKSLDPSWVKEFEKLKSDGHEVTETERFYSIVLKPGVVRVTQLYRTLPHEIGHYKDYKESGHKYKTKSARDKEAFAHRYADELRKNLIAQKISLK